MSDTIKQLLEEYGIKDEPKIREELGHGAYAVVKKIIVYETECAAKTIHETLISDDQTGTIATKYKDELELQSKLRHPNIIQFLGIIEFPGSSLPALVTELMHSNMHDFLLRPDMQNAISLSHKRLMLTDIAKGLHYLHKNHIVHRDLTANNVLLTPSLVAKIADLGNSRILPEIEFKKLTTQPGTQVYMPPEANQGYYDDKLDIFSFGHLILFALIQVFPEKLLNANFLDPASRILKPRTEVERREKYFEQLDEKIPDGGNHPLAEMSRQCLEYLPENRPDVIDILHRLQSIRWQIDSEGLYEGLNSIEVSAIERQKIGDEILRQCDSRIKEIEEIFQQKEAELSQLHQRIDKIRDSLKERLERLSHNNKDLTIKSGDQHAMMPQQCKQPPFEMSNYTKAVVVHNRIYVGGGFTSSTKNLATVLEYDYQTGDWKEIEEQCPRKYFGMAVARNKLYVVAGVDVTKGLRQGSIYTLDLESTDTIWKEFPCAPMNDNRSTPSVVSYDEKWLIVIGGKSMNGVALDSVEAVNIEDPVDQRHWCRSPKFPIKCAHFSSAVVNDHVFTFATKMFKGNSERFSNSVFYAPLISLMPSGDKSNAESTMIWKEIRNLPLKASTAVSYEGSLLALGGIEKDSIASSCIFKLKYNPNTDEHLVWKKIDDLPCALYQCAAVQILDQIFIHGCCETSDVCVYVHSLHTT